MEQWLQLSAVASLVMDSQRRMMITKPLPIMSNSEQRPADTARCRLFLFTSHCMISSENSLQAMKLLMLFCAISMSCKVAHYAPLA